MESREKSEFPKFSRIRLRIRIFGSCTILTLKVNRLSIHHRGKRVEKTKERAIIRATTRVTIKVKVRVVIIMVTIIMTIADLILTNIMVVTIMVVTNSFMMVESNLMERKAEKGRKVMVKKVVWIGRTARATRIGVVVSIEMTLRAAARRVVKVGVRNVQ